MITTASIRTDAASAPASAPVRRRRRTLPPRLAFTLAAAIVGLGLLASVTPSPLYQAYSAEWHLAPLTLTLVYATYAIGVLVTLLAAGSVSDDVGRRPVLLLSLAALMVSTLMFIVASSVAWLFVARGLQGLATGAAISAASAALLDLHPRRDPAAAGLANAVASSLGIALGILGASALVQLGPAPLALPYVVLFALLAVAFAGVVWMPEPVADRRGVQWRINRPHVPAAVRGPFLLAALTVISAWSLGGLFFSLGPALGSRLLDSASVVLSSVGIVVLAASAALAQLLLRRIAPWKGALIGSIALATGVALIVLATALDSGALYLVGSVIGGVGFGIGFLGGLRALLGAIPSEHRASVMSAYYTVAYLSLSLPAVVGGLIVGALGLAVTFEVVGAIVVLIAFVAAIVAWRARPALRRTDVATRRGGAGR